MKRLPTILLAAAFASSVASAEPPDSTLLPARIERFQSAFDEANRLSGVLFIQKGDNVLLHNAYGPAGAHTGLSTPFAIASITKILTTVIVFQLLLEERLAVDDPISRWIPDFPHGDSITVGHLLSHRSGIRHRVTTPEEEVQHQSAASMVELARRLPLVFPPGSQSSYSTAGYAVLARVVELVENKPFAVVLDQRIFMPAGMTDSYDLTMPEGRQPPAPPLLPAHGKLAPAPARDLSFLVGGGSTVSTSGDMLRFVRALREGKLGSVQFSHIAPDGTGRWVGATNGYFSWLDVFPDEGLTIIYLGNTWGGAGPALRDALPMMLRGEDPQAPEIPAAVEMPDAATLQEYNGEYQSRPGAFFRVVARQDDLLFEDNYLVPIGKDQFWQPAWSTSLHFIRDDSGYVVALERADGTRWSKVGESP